MIPDNIPEQLRKLGQWVLHRNKVPYSGKTGARASTTDRGTWTNFEDALRESKDGNGYDGVGFVFSGQDPFTGIDLDHCVKDGAIQPWAQEIIDRLDSYSEFSPSGTGIHIFVKGDLPDGSRNRKGDIEMYSRGRYFTVTGHRVEGTPDGIIDRQEELNLLHRELFHQPNKSTQPRPAGFDGDDEALLEKARGSENGDKFASLFDRGETSGYPSESEADLALCGLLAFWTGPDSERIDRLFQRSALCRDKWVQRADYRQKTISKALADRTEFFTPTTSPSNKSPVQAAKQGQPWATTDLGNARRLAYYGGYYLRYCHAWGCWMIWDGKRWKRDDKLEFVKYAKTTSLRIYDEVKQANDEAQHKSLAKWATASQKSERLNAMIGLARCELAVSPAQLDTDPWLLNVLNGTVDLKTGELIPPRREDLITKLAPVRFDITAKCPMWESFLQRIMDNNDVLIGYLQRIAGMCLTGDVREQYLFLFYGVGANGKNVFLDTLSGLMGDYADEAPPDLLVARKTDEHPTEIADLCGLRLAITSELEEGKRLRVQLMKRLTGNRQLKGRFMRQDYFHFNRTHKLIVATNNKPIVREDTHAVWRRLRLIPFNVVIPEAEQDKQLTEKLIKEWPGILNLMIKGCLDWQRCGLQAPEEVDEATGDYQAEQDVLAEFIDEKCVLGPDAYVSRTDILNAYQKWADENRERYPLERRALYDRLRKKDGITETMRRLNGKPTHVFCGVGLSHSPPGGDVIA